MLAVATARRVAGAVVGLLLAIDAGIAGAQTPFRLRTIVEENIRTGIGTFRDLSVAGVTRQGQVMFLADREDVRDEDDQGLFLWVDGRIVRLIGRDDSVPGGKIRQITRAALAPRTAASRVFLATVRNGVGAESQALFVTAKNQLRRVARVGETLGPGRLLALDPATSSLQVNSQGEVLFLAQLDVDGNGSFDEAADAIGLFLYTGGRLRLLQHTREASLGMEAVILLGERALNDRGRVTWELSPANRGRAIIVSDRGRIRRVIGRRDAVPGGRILDLGGPVLNEPGNVAFVAVVDRNGNDTFDTGVDETVAFLLRSEGTPSLQALLRSSRLERGASSLSGVETLNDRNQAVVLARVDTNQNGRPDAEDLEATYVASTAEVAAVARAGRRIRLGGDVFGGELRLTRRPDAARMSNRGEIALSAFVDTDDTGDFDPSRDDALILDWNGAEPEAVVRDGQTFATLFGDGRLRNVRGPDGLTDAGVIVFTADIDRDADGDIDPDDEGRAIFLALPTGRQ